MESITSKRKWITLLLTATMSIALLFGATACNDTNNDGNTDVIVEDNEPTTVVPDVDVDVNTESDSPSASATASAK
jgi:hypothetical protein